MKPRLYLAGAMSGLPEMNYPAFFAEAERLRAIGYLVENPADNPVQDSWQGYMRVAIAQLVKCDAVALLPGWENSRGARIENDLAISLGIKARPCEEFQARTPDPKCWLCSGEGKDTEGDECTVCVEVRL